MKDQYNGVARFLHWSIALLIIVNVLVALYMDELPKADKISVESLHRSIGILILEMVLFRIFWAFYKPAPPLPDSIPAKEKKLGKIVQHSLYLLMLLVPVFGYLLTITEGDPASFFNLYNLPAIMGENEAWQEFFEEGHEILAWTLVALSSLHIAAGIKHLISKDGIFERMWPKK